MNQKEQINRNLGLSCKEKEMLGEFFKELLLIDGGVYTLYGSKPITGTDISNCTAEEIKDSLQELKASGKTPDFTISLKYELYDSWDVLKKVLKKKTPKNYIFKKKSYDKYNPNKAEVLLINISLVQNVLNSHYSQFRDFVGHDFDADAVVYELNKKNSKFWDKLLYSQNHLLLGLLFGYGIDNANEFIKRNFTNSFASDKYLPHNEISPSKFQLPMFRSFKKEDPIVSQYKSEQKHIKKLYADKDFVDVTLNQIFTHKKFQVLPTLK